MHEFNFNYNAEDKHLTVTVTDTKSNQVIEVVNYWHLSGSRFDFSQRKAEHVTTWRENEEPLIRLESLSAAARLACVLSLSSEEQLEYSASEVEEDDVSWLFDKINKQFFISSGQLEPLNPYIDFHSDMPVSAFFH
ncbi:Uncharacterised protein [Vibrio cholerae]|uniref:hypothetical protein n=1 Tax=Vibrio cholerae TaxID=666 RepID=UPI000663A5E4|nr:hypothetical protein [Vibrio cholerae]ELG2042948.1 hypothetical protein [Vibrio fluvialis]ELL4669144.1 hypothetical protein [Vibrio fluvialis]MBY7962045.1 hypothetical protein [Vibrio fluvialis]MBY8077929.1 hypothetical protein [Vibrio fluvialis]CSC85006.1 Uncharacterised protein [Vibrio cholerae]